MLKIIKNSIIIILIFTLCFATGCSDDNTKKTDDSKELGSSVTSVEQDNSSAQSGSSGTNTHDSQEEGAVSGSTSTSTSSATSSSDNSSYSYNSGTSSRLDTTTKEQAATYKKTVTTVLDCIKYGDYPTVKKNVIFDQEQEPLGFDDAAIKRVKKIFAYLDYKITSAKYIADYEGKVTVKITALDFDAIFSAYIKKSIKLTRSGKEYTEKQLNKKLDEAFNASFNVNAKKVTKKITLHVFKTEDGWKIRDSIDFARACLGGADSINSIIQKAGEEQMN